VHPQSVAGPASLDRLFIGKWPAFRREWRLARASAEFPIRPDDVVARARAAGEWYGRVAKKEKPYADLTAKWIAFADPAGELTWTKLKTWSGEDEASTARAQVAALSGDEFQLIRLGRHDFDSVNSGLVFGLGKRRWKFFPLDLDRGA